MSDYWTRTDYENGLIEDVGLIGQPVFPTIDSTTTDQPDPADIPEPTVEQLALANLPPEFVYERELADYHADRAAYRAKAGANLSKLMAIGEDRKKEIAAKAQSIDNLTEKRLAPLSGDEWARAVVHAFASAPEDCRSYLRRELMLTDEFIEQHLQE